MTIPRIVDPRQLELGVITKQFETCAGYHSRFIEQPELDRATKFRLRDLAGLYQRYREEAGMHEIIGKVPHVMELTDWKSKPPLERYDIINSWRAKDQARFTDQFIAQMGLTIPGYNRLDVGASSGYFMATMNEREIEKGSGVLWFGTDIPDDRVHLAKGTERDRALLTPAFQEYEPGGELPFKNTKFGLATMYYTLHHVDDKYLEPGAKNNVLKQVYDRLEPGGYLLVLEDNIGNATVDKTRHAFIKMQDDIFYPNAPGHQRTMREWHDILKANGFEVPRVGEVPMYNNIGIMTQEAILLARKPLAAA